MASDQDIRLFELLEEAAGWPQAERCSRAQEACEGRGISPEALLAALATTQLDGFLETPAWQSVSRRVTGDVVGGYRLGERLGEGGMGEVFLAEQAEPRRQVALKLVHIALTTTELRDLFRAEQEAGVLEAWPDPYSVCARVGERTPIRFVRTRRLP